MHELGDYYRETIQLQMVEDSHRIEQELKVQKAEYRNAVRDLNVLMEEQKRVHHHVVRDIHHAGLAEKTPQPEGSAVQRFKQNFRARVW